MTTVLTTSAICITIVVLALLWVMHQTNKRS